MEVSKFISHFNNQDFQVRLMENPHQALQSVGVNIPAQTKVKVLRNSKENLNFIMPTLNDLVDNQGKGDWLLSDEDLEKISAGELGLVGTLIVFGTAITVVVAGLAATIGASIAVTDFSNY